MISSSQKGRTKKKEKKGDGVRNPCRPVVEVTEIRRGAAWRVNGKETLKRGANPSCLSARRNPESLGGGKKER